MPPSFSTAPDHANCLAGYAHKGQTLPFATANFCTPDIFTPSIASRFLIIIPDHFKREKLYPGNSGKGQGLFFNMTGKSQFSHSSAKGQLLADSTADSIGVSVPTQPCTPSAVAERATQLLAPKSKHYT